MTNPQAPSGDRPCLPINGLPQEFGDWRRNMLASLS